MAERIEAGVMAFLADGAEGIGGVRSVCPTSLVIYVENAGEFTVPLLAVAGVHSQKVMLNPRKLDKVMLKAIGHAHDGEDPSVAG
jgi:hypothetical protein